MEEEDEDMTEEEEEVRCSSSSWPATAGSRAGVDGAAARHALGLLAIRLCCMRPPCAADSLHVLQAR